MSRAIPVDLPVIEFICVISPFGRTLGRRGHLGAHVPLGPVPAPRVSRSQDMRDPRSSRGNGLRVQVLSGGGGHVGPPVPLGPGFALGSVGRAGTGGGATVGPALPVEGRAPSGTVSRLFGQGTRPWRGLPGFPRVRENCNRGPALGGSPYHMGGVLLCDGVMAGIGADGVVHTDVMVALAVLRARYGGVKGLGVRGWRVLRVGV